MYTHNKLFLLECKSHKGNTFPLSNLTQFGKLRQYKDIDGVKVGVIIWFIDHDEVIYVPIETIIKLADDQEKSLKLKHFDSEDYKIYKLNSEKKRTFLITDYRKLLEVL